MAIYVTCGIVLQVYDYEDGTIVCLSVVIYS